MPGLSVPHDMRVALTEACADSDMAQRSVITLEIMRDLLAACKDKPIHASRSHSLWKNPDSSFESGSIMISSQVVMSMSLN
jgi:hypothetical protein